MKSATLETCQSDVGAMPSRNVSKHQLRLRLRVGEATPWPALCVRVEIHVNGHVLNLDELHAHNGTFYHQRIPFMDADPLDTLLLRNLLQQPRGDVWTRLIGGREFAPLLALLRQHSENCDYAECERVRRLEIQSEAAEPMLELSAPAGGQEAQPRVLIRPHFRSAETADLLGQVLHRGPTYWTFERAITPAPSLPADERLKKLFTEAQPANSKTLAREAVGEEALDLLRRARSAAREDELLVRIDPALHVWQDTAQPVRLRTDVVLEDDETIRVAHELVAPDGTRIPGAVVAAQVGSGQSEWISYGGRQYRLPADAAANFRLPPEKRISGEDIADFVQDQLPKLREQGAQIDEKVASLCVCAAVKPSVAVEATGGNAVEAQLFFQPVASPESTSSLEAATARIDPVELLAAAARGQRYLRRGNLFIRADREAVARCRRQLERVVQDDSLQARDEQIPQLLEWAKQAQNDVHTPWNIYVAEAVDGAHKIKDQPASVRFSLDVEEEEDGDTWFTLEPMFEQGGRKFSEDELRKLVKEGKRWLRDGDEWVKLDPEALEKFELAVEESGVHRHRGRRRRFYYRFRPAARDRITDIFSLSGTFEHAERYKKFLDQLRGFDTIQSLPKPAGMTLSLRPYQQQGFEWMAFLAHYGLNGILADDMGLGKTAQTLALLTHTKEQKGRAPALIVTPTSLVDNWASEVQKFSPGLVVMTYRGAPARRDKLREQIGEHDLVLCTYATARNDASLLRQIPWRYVILDEAHFIKNSAAATTKAIKTIPARHRLALTGTPIQNRLTELWSLFDFLMPEFLGRQMRFRETYEEPIATMQSGRAETEEQFQNGEAALERLRERIRPFVLRRLKTDVARDLPPKIENDIFCHLGPEQIALYKGFADSAEAKEAVNELVEKGADGACTAILAALTSLRKICNHPDLMMLPKNAGRQKVERPLPGYQERSGKLEALGELLQQCKEGGHRSLIFCQQTTMLDILGHFLTDNGLKFLRLDGSTPGESRQALVRQFNGDPSLDAFLISTRAGGAGLNLTGADTVIFYDHDWNPANDQQAQDRAYRIGQQRTVNVYRLICKGTLEEKILRRQMLKRKLADSIVTHDVAGMKELTRDELLNLFTLSEDEPETPATASAEATAQNA